MRVMVKTKNRYNLFLLNSEKSVSTIANTSRMPYYGFKRHRIPALIFYATLYTLTFNRCYSSYSDSNSSKSSAGGSSSSSKYSSKNSLICMTCIAHQHQTTQLDKFRIRAKLFKPQCTLETIKCDRDQDVCVTITMHIGGGQFWIGAGCDRHESFNHIACENIPTSTRNIQMGLVQEKRVVQRVCVCNSNFCNRSNIHRISFLLIIIAIILLLDFFTCHRHHII